MSEKKNNNIRLLRDRERHIGEEYNSAESMSRSAGLEQRIKYQKKQKQRRLKAKRRRTLIALILLCAAVCVVLFLTPIFDIRTISVEGNAQVTEEQLTNALSPLVGQNLLRTGSSKIEAMLCSEIPYIKSADVQKQLFPPSVGITVSEYTPAALLRTDGKSIITSSTLHALQEADGSARNVPSITGIEVADWQFASDVTLSSGEKQETLITMLRTLESSGILDGIIEIDLNNLSYIIMNYDDRIEVKCGTQLDIDRKIRLLKEAVTSNSLASNARGTIDLSETGKAVYTP